MSLIYLSHYLLLLILTLLFYTVGRSFLRAENVKKLFLILLAGDLVFLVLNALLKGRFHLDMDRGYPEVYGYGKELLCSGIMLALALRPKKGLWLFLSMVTFYIFLDDAFMFHERTGVFLSRHLDLASLSRSLGIRCRDVGEALYYLTVFAVLVVPSAFFFFTERDAWHRKNAGKIVVALGLFGFLGTGLDIIDQRFKTLVVQHFFNLFENYGEMLAFSLAAAFCVDAWIDRRAAGPVPATR